MALDFQQPSSMMASVPTLAQSRAVAPPGRKERAVTFLARTPVVGSCTLATCWIALVTYVDLAGVGLFTDRWRFWIVWIGVVGWAFCV